MIVVDSSCLLAILQNEPEKRNFESVLAGADRFVMSAVNVLESLCVMRGRHGPAGIQRFWELFTAADIEIIAFDGLQMRAAAAAFERYGKGINSKSSLNLADCAAYALAKTLSAPLLFKGEDFTNTDIIRAAFS